MHPSRMCTARSLPWGGGSLSRRSVSVQGSLYPGGGGGSLSRGSLSRRFLSRVGWGWCLCPRSLSRGVSVQGVSDWGVFVVGSLSGRPPPPVNRMTDRCKNITFLQLRLRAVKISLLFH